MELVRDVMAPNVICVPEKMSVRELCRTLEHNEIAGAPVVDAQDYLVGVVTLTDVTRFAAGDKAGLGDAYIHGIGHHLGLSVHDASPDAPIRAGAVITIEPGVYLRDEKIGVRIEDDILITANTSRNLSKMIPKDPDEIERLMRLARRRRT